MYAYGVTMARCSFARNGAVFGGALYFLDGYGDRINHTIIADGISGGAVGCGDGAPLLKCCDIFGNAGGDWTGCIADQYGMSGNICEDPLFCDPAIDDFNLSCESPCAAENNPECGQIGAWPVGCGGPSPVITTTWGHVKSLFRE